MIKLKKLSGTLAILLMTVLAGCSGATTDPVSSEVTLQKASEFDEALAGPEFMGPGHRGHQMRLMGEVLGLSEAQKEQIQTILKENFKQSKPGRGHGKASPEERKARRQEMHDAMHEKMMTVLTDEQRVKAEQFKAQLEKGEVPQEFIDKHVETLTEKLGLSEEQQAQIRALEHAKERHALRNKDGKRKERHEEMLALREKHEADMMQILTPEQQAVFKEMHEERKGKMQKHRKHFRGQGRGQHIKHLTEALNLNEEQQAQLKQIFEDARPGIKEGHEPGGRRHHGEMREAMEARREAVHTKIKTILTEEQVKLFDEFLAERKGRRN